MEPGWVEQGGHVDRGMFMLGVNRLSVSLDVRTFSPPGESSLLWQKNDRDLMGIMAVPLSVSLFLTWTDRSQIHYNRAYFNTFSVGTQGWLKINNLSIALCTLSFFGVSFSECALLLLPCLLCCIVQWGIFFFSRSLLLSSILWRSRNAFLGAVSDTAQSSSFSFII